ncbi:hypothetical protein J6I39_09195 [bacterium]|nr:hypothetical protein [bacterium]
MKKFFLILFLFMFLCIGICSGNAQQPTMLTGSVSMVPKSFYGTWRVTSQRVEQNADIFKEKSLDIWNLSRTGDVITLYNMFNGAKAEINVENSDDSHVIFTKYGKNNKKKLTDRADIYIDGDTFSGYDYIKIDTYVNGKIVKTQSAKYKIKGEKIGGGITTE